jgi:hypothetical protein
MPNDERIWLWTAALFAVLVSFISLLIVSVKCGVM